MFRIIKTADYPESQRDRCKGIMLLRKTSFAPQSGQCGPTGSLGFSSGSGGIPFCFIINERIVLTLMEALELMNPKCLTFMNPEGRTCWRKRRMNSRTSSDMER